MAVVFDTHSRIERPKDAGFSEERAEAEVGLVREALAVNLKDLATKQDLRELELHLEAGLKDARSHLESKLKDTESHLDAKLATGQQDLAAQKTDMARLKWLTGAFASELPAQLLRSAGVS